MAQRRFKKFREGGGIHLAGRHREFPMAGLSASTDVAMDRHVVGRIGKSGAGSLRAKEPAIGFGVQRVAAQNLVTSQQPKIAGPGDCGPQHGGNRPFGRFTAVLRQRLDAQIDFANVESGRLERKIEAGACKLLQCFAEQPIIPGGDFGQAIVGDRKGPALGGGQMSETDGRDFGQAKKFRGEHASMAGDDIILAVDKNGHIEPEALNAAGDLTDLLLCVNAGVPGVRFQTFDWHIADCQIRACVCRARRLSVSAHRCFSSFSRGVDRQHVKKQPENMGLSK